MKTKIKLPKIFFIIFFCLCFFNLTTVILAADPLPDAGAGGGGTAPPAETAEEEKKPRQTFIPGFSYTEETEIGDFIQAIYAFASAVIVIVAIIAVMKGGMEWILAGGQSDKISKAKDTIFKALIGLLIAIFAVVILQTVSPGTVLFKSLNIKSDFYNEGSIGGTPCESSTDCDESQFCFKASATNNRCSPKANIGGSCLFGLTVDGTSNDQCLNGDKPSAEGGTMCHREICVYKNFSYLGSDGTPCTHHSQCQNKSCKCEGADNVTRDNQPACQTGVCASKISSDNSRFCDGWEVKNSHPNGDNNRCESGDCNEWGNEKCTPPPP